MVTHVSERGSFTIIVKPQGASIDGGMKEGEGARAVGLSVGFLFLLLVVVVVV